MSGVPWEPELSSANDIKIDPVVVAALYAEHADELRQFLVGVLKDADAAGEVLQASFARAVESGHTAREETRKGWLFRVAFHEALAFRRRGLQRDRTLQRFAGEVRSTGESPEDPLIRGELVESVKVALEQLPAEQRRVVRMRIYEEKTFAVIASELNVPLGTVLTRMRAALKKLRQHLKGTIEF